MVLTDILQPTTFCEVQDAFQNQLLVIVYEGNSVGDNSLVHK